MKTARKSPAARKPKSAAKRAAPARGAKKAAPARLASSPAAAALRDKMEQHWNSDCGVLNISHLTGWRQDTTDPAYLTPFPGARRDVPDMLPAFLKRLRPRDYARWKLPAAADARKPPKAPEWYRERAKALSNGPALIEGYAQLDAADRHTQPLLDFIDARRVEAAADILARVGRERLVEFFERLFRANAEKYFGIYDVDPANDNWPAIARVFLTMPNAKKAA